MRFGILFVAVLLVVMPLIPACGDDDEPKDEHNVNYENACDTISPCFGDADACEQFKESLPSMTCRQAVAPCADWARSEGKDAPYDGPLCEAFWDCFSDGCDEEIY